MNAMNNELMQQVEAYATWKNDLIREIGNYQEWLEDNGLSEPENDLRIYETLEALRSDKITIAFVAEVSRGKTELINTLFFSQYKRRLLPSQAGRTTMCPTEIFYDHDAERPYIRLLPIETRLDEKSIAELKNEEIEWTNINLDIDSADSLTEAFSEVTRTKRVSVERAKELGLYDEQLYAHLESQDIPTTHIEIPRWRHAMINFPHPMLKQGLVVLDTPGLNAIGCEPELTLNMLPNAQAVLFLIAADTGVTKSDMDMWHNHINTYRLSHNKGLLVVMNKIDTLWDELQDAKTIQNNIENQCKKTAEELRIGRENIFPISAQKGLLARVKDDDVLLNNSGLPALEHALSRDVLPEKHHIISENIISEIGSMIENDRTTLQARAGQTRKQRDELQTLCGKNADVIMHLLKKTREEQIVYNKNIEDLSTSKRIMGNYSTKLLEHLDLSTLDNLVAQTRKDMTGSWTTAGMKGGMKTFFDNVTATMDEASEQAIEIHKLVRAIYHKFHKEHGFKDMQPKLFTTERFKKELNLLYREADLFRKSPVTTMTEQGFVVKKFFISMVSKARNIFFNANQEASRWSKEVIGPIAAQVKEHKAAIQKRLETLRRISDSRDTLESKIEELDKELQSVDAQLAAINLMLEVVRKPFVAPVPDDNSRSATADAS